MSEANSKELKKETKAPDEEMLKNLDLLLDDEGFEISAQFEIFSYINRESSDLKNEESGEKLENEVYKNDDVKKKASDI